MAVTKSHNADEFATLLQLGVALAGTGLLPTRWARLVRMAAAGVTLVRLL